jgi:hypothetical protein
VVRAVARRCAGSTRTSRVPSSCCEMHRLRTASLARPPALRITCISLQPRARRRVSERHEHQTRWCGRRAAWGGAAGVATLVPRDTAVAHAGAAGAPGVRWPHARARKADTHPSARPSAAAGRMRASWREAVRCVSARLTCVAGDSASRDAPPLHAPARRATTTRTHEHAALRAVPLRMRTRSSAHHANHNRGLARGRHRQLALRAKASHVCGVGGLDSIVLLRRHDCERSGVGSGARLPALLTRVASCCHVSRCAQPRQLRGATEADGPVACEGGCRLAVRSSKLAAGGRAVASAVSRSR